MLATCEVFPVGGAHPARPDPSVLLEEHLSESSESSESGKTGRDSETRDSYWKGWWE